jgi:hypothetical protein
MPKPDSMFKRLQPINEDAFVNSGALPGAEPPQAEVIPPASAFVAAPRTKPRSSIHSYKHKDDNYILLRRLAQLLDVTIGDLLDEALEAKLPEFKTRAGKLAEDL